MSVAALALGLLLLLLAPVHAQDRQRLDLFDAKGRRAGYAVLDERNGRIDLFDASSRRIGWGRVEPRTGDAVLFDAQGRRQFEWRLGPGTPTPTR